MKISPCLAEVTQNCLYNFKFGYFSYKKPCEARFNMDGCALFDYFRTVEQ